MDAAFCHRCGERLEGGAAPSVEPDERVVWTDRPRARSLGGWAILAAGWAVLVVATQAAYAPAWRWLGWAAAAVAAVPMLILSWVGLARRLRWRYRLTTHRLRVEGGILRTVVAEINLADVIDISVQQGPIEQIVNVGRVTVFSRTGGGLRIDLEHVDRPLALRDRIRSLKEARAASTGSGAP